MLRPQLSRTLLACAASAMLLSACSPAPEDLGAQRSAAPDLVLTPIGMIDRSRVHSVEDGSVNVSQLVTSARPSLEHVSGTNAPLGVASIEYATNTLSSSWYTQVVANLTVPPAPTSAYTASQGLLIGPRLVSPHPTDGGSASSPIVYQSALSYGGGIGNGQWNISSWNCYTGTGGFCAQGSVVSVKPGDSLQFSMVANSCTNTGSCGWHLTIEDLTQGTASNLITANVGSEGAVIVYPFTQASLQLDEEGLAACATYPSNGGAVFTNLALVNGSGAKVTPSWSPTVSEATPDCGFGVTVSSPTSVDLKYEACVPEGAACSAAGQCCGAISCNAETSTCCTVQETTINYFGTLAACKGPGAKSASPCYQECYKGGSSRFECESNGACECWLCR